MTTVSIGQPCYLSWCGSFDRIAKSDVSIILDHVHMSGGEAKNKILTKDGAKELIVPVKHDGIRRSIADVLVANDGKWQRKHYLAIQNSYARSLNASKHMEFFAELYTGQREKLTDYIYPVMEYTMEQWNIETPLVKSTDLVSRGSKSQLNLDLCLEVGADRFLVGPGTYSFLDKTIFEDAGIEIILHDYAAVHPTYKQLWGSEFVPCLSAVDALMNVDRMPVT